MIKVGEDENGKDILDTVAFNNYEIYRTKFHKVKAELYPGNSTQIIPEVAKIPDANQATAVIGENAEAD